MRSRTDTEAKRRSPGKRSVFLRILLFFSIPLVIVAVASSISYLYYTRSLEREILSEYAKNVGLLSERVRTTFEELQRSVLLLQEFEEIATLLGQSAPASDRDALLLNRGAHVLSTFENTRTMIGDVWIYFREADFVLTSGGTVSSRLFFEEVHRLEDYPRRFWQELDYSVSSSLSLYPPSIASTQLAEARRYLPLVFRGIEPARARNLIVVDVDVWELQRLFLSYLFTRNSDLMLTDNSGRMYVIATTSEDAATGDAATEDAATEDAATEDEALKGDSRRRSGNGTLVIAEPLQIFKNDYVLAAFVPASEIASRTAAFRASVLAMLAAGLLVGMVLSVVLSRRLYAPLRDMVLLMRNHDEGAKAVAGNEYEYLRSQIDRLYSAERRLKRDLSQALPLAYERCLLQIVRTGSNEYEEELRSFLRDAGNDFIHEGFCTVLVRYAYDAEYYKAFSGQAEVELQSTVAGLVGQRMGPEVRAYPVALEPHIQCIVLNLPIGADVGELKERFRALLADLDLRWVRLAVSIGQALSGLSGVATSYSQARQKLSLMIHGDEDPVQVYDGESPEGYSMSRTAETRIENFLSTGDEGAALAELSDVVEENRARGASEAEMRLLHLVTYSIARRVLESAGGSVTDVCPDCEGLSEEISGESPLYEAHERLEQFYRKVCRYASARQAKSDVREIAQYIQDNYAGNIYLESIADHFGLSYKYLSHKIRDYLGIPFQQYLTKLRISKAKELLASSDMRIARVAAEVGYDSTSTFYRVFKKHEGITAGQYRRARTNGDEAR